MTGYTIDVKLMVTIRKLEKNVIGTDITEVVKRNMELDDVGNIDDLKTYLNMFIDVIEKGLK